MRTKGWKWCKSRNEAWRWQRRPRHRKQRSSLVPKGLLYRHPTAWHRSPTTLRAAWLLPEGHTGSAEAGCRDHAAPSRPLMHVIGIS